MKDESVIDRHIQSHMCYVAETHPHYAEVDRLRQGDPLGSTCDLVDEFSHKQPLSRRVNIGEARQVDAKVMLVYIPNKTPAIEGIGTTGSTHPRLAEILACYV